MFQQMKRPYKDSSAADTIARLKEITHRLGLEVKEGFNGNPYPQIYSMRVELDESQGGFGTNGKGRSNEYSLASGYAEFLERIQNGMMNNFSRTMIQELKGRHGFYYFPDEQTMDEEEVAALPPPVLDDLVRFRAGTKRQFISAYFQRLRENGFPGVVAVPFFDTRRQTRQYIPLNLLILTVGSNGMAAGNTIPEAVFQGLCELLERWGSAEVFYRELTPPTVPDDFLARFPEEWEIIRAIRAGGTYEVIVKDFSAARRIPALGIVVVNRETGKYRLNVGSDTCFQVALSRCLTEIYQGCQNERQFDSFLRDIPGERPEYFVRDDDTARRQRVRVFSEFTKDGSGVYPPSLFAAQPSYPFDPTVFTPRESYEAEVQGLVATFHRQGRDVYIRDVSFLGFPSVFVYVPEISAMGRKAMQQEGEIARFNNIEMDHLESLMFRFPAVSAGEMRRMAEFLQNFHEESQLFKLFNVDLRKDSPWGKLEVAFFLTLLWYRLGDLDKARENFAVFRRRREKNPAAYYDVAEKYLQYGGSAGNGEIRARLEADGFAAEVIDEVVQDLADPAQAFRHLRFPACPDCPRCPLEPECLTTRKIRISHRIHAGMREKPIDQLHLRRFFPPAP